MRLEQGCSAELSRRGQVVRVSVRTAGSKRLSADIVVGGSELGSNDETAGDWIRPPFVLADHIGVGPAVARGFLLLI